MEKAERLLEALVSLHQLTDILKKKGEITIYSRKIPTRAGSCHKGYLLLGDSPALISCPRTLLTDL